MALLGAFLLFLLKQFAEEANYTVTFIGFSRVS